MSEIRRFANSMVERSSRQKPERFNLEPKDANISQETYKGSSSLHHLDSIQQVNGKFSQPSIQTLPEIVRGPDLEVTMKTIIKRKKGNEVKSI